MYKISVPVMNAHAIRSGRERLVEELHRLDAERVFLAMDTYELDPQKQKENFETLRENVQYFKKQGFEVGAWTWTFWIVNNTRYLPKQAVDGTEYTDFVCPLDEEFRAFAKDYLEQIAATGVDLIMFDDDFRYGYLGGPSPACLCDLHLDAIRNIVGENCSRELVREQILKGGKNKYRDAWLQVNGDGFRLFAKEMRTAVDRVDPAIRLGACACMTSWDIDGTDAYELAKIMAGNTKPFVRLIGAPYWAVNKSYNSTLQDVVELERMESAWTRNGEIEIMAEGDAYPRPRINCPANFVEGFDTAIRASGCTDGILKYGIDYYSNADYELGYAKMHERNRPFYKEIDRLFGDKESCGIRVYHTMQKAADAQDPGEELQDLFYPTASRSLVACSIPTVFEGSGVTGICFGENARKLPPEALKKGLILDAVAAKILTERGIDVGITRFGEQVKCEEEHFLYNDNYIATVTIPSYDIALCESAEILSDGEANGKTIPLSYRYENAAGNRFLVLNYHIVNLGFRPAVNSVLRQYERKRQYIAQTPWLSGEKLPVAVLTDHPNLYVQCKKNETAMAIGLWNFFADPAIDPVLQLDHPYRSVEAVNCTAALEGDRITLSELPPYGFALIELK